MRGISTLSAIILLALTFVITLGVYYIAYNLFHTSKSTVSGTSSEVLTEAQKISLSNKRIIIITQSSNIVQDLKKALESMGATVEVQTSLDIDPFVLARYDLIIFVPEKDFIAYSNYARESVILIPIDEGTFEESIVGTTESRYTGTVTRGINIIDKGISRTNSYRLLKIYVPAIALDTLYTSYSPVLRYIDGNPATISSCKIFSGTFTVNAVYFVSYFKTFVIRDYIIVPQKADTITIIDESDNDDTKTYESVSECSIISTPTAGTTPNCGTSSEEIDFDILEFRTNYPSVLLFGVIPQEYTTELQNVPQKVEYSLCVPSNKVLFVPLVDTQVYLEGDYSYSGEVSAGTPILINTTKHKIYWKVVEPEYKIFLVQERVLSTYTTGYGIKDCIVVDNSTSKVYYGFRVPEGALVRLVLKDNEGKVIYEDIIEKSVEGTISIKVKDYGVLCFFSTDFVYYYLYPDNLKNGMKLLHPVMIPSRDIIGQLSKYANVLYLAPTSLYDVYRRGAYVYGTDVSLNLREELSSNEVLRGLYSVTLPTLSTFSTVGGFSLYSVGDLPVISEYSTGKYKVVVAPSSLLNSEKGIEVVLGLVEYLLFT